MIKDMIKWRPILIGVIIVTILSTLSILSSQSTGSMFLLIGLVVGFMVGSNFKEGALNGAIFGIIGGLIALVIILIIYSIMGYGSMIGLIITSQLVNLVLEIGLAVAGGILGSFIKTESQKNRTALPKEE